MFPDKNFGLVKFPLGQMVPRNDQSQIAQFCQSCKKLFTIPFTLKKYIQRPYLHKQKTHTSTSQQVPEHLLFFEKTHICQHVFSCASHLFGGFPMISQVSHDFSMTLVTDPL
jgi:uncharacterized protein VirK/YbjX